MHDVERRTGRLGGRDGLRQSGESAAHVNVRRGAARPRPRLNIRSNLSDRRSRRVGAAEANRDGALRRGRAQDRLHGRHLRLIRRAAAADPRGQQALAGVAQYLHPCRDVAHRHAEVHDLARLASRIPRVHVAGADLEFERGGHAIAHHHRVGLFLLSVLVKVDEAWRDHVVRRVDDARACERRLGNRVDASRRVMPTCRTASSFDSGSITRPFAMTRS